MSTVGRDFEFAVLRSHIHLSFNCHFSIFFSFITACHFSGFVLCCCWCHKAGIKGAEPLSSRVRWWRKERWGQAAVVGVSIMFPSLIRYCWLDTGHLAYKIPMWHTHTPVLRPSWILSGTTQVSRYQKGKTMKVNNLDLLKQEMVSGSGISWAVCKSAPWPRHITKPASHHSVFYRPDALPTNSAKALKACKRPLWLSPKASPVHMESGH